VSKEANKELETEKIFFAEEHLSKVFDILRTVLFRLPGRPFLKPFGDVFWDIELSEKAFDSGPGFFIVEDYYVGITTKKGGRFKDRRCNVKFLTLFVPIDSLGEMAQMILSGHAMIALEIQSAIEGVKVVIFKAMKNDLDCLAINLIWREDTEEFLAERQAEQEAKKINEFEQWVAQKGQNERNKLAMYMVKWNMERESDIPRFPIDSTWKALRHKKVSRIGTFEIARELADMGILLPQDDLKKARPINVDMAIRFLNGEFVIGKGESDCRQ